MNGVSRKKVVEDLPGEFEDLESEPGERVGKICPLLFMASGKWDSDSLCVEGGCAWWTPLDGNPDGGMCAVKVLPLALGEQE